MSRAQVLSGLRGVKVELEDNLLEDIKRHSERYMDDGYHVTKNQHAIHLSAAKLAFVSEIIEELEDHGTIGEIEIGGGAEE